MWLPLQLLSVTLWAGVNVLDSLLVKRFQRSPLALMWNQSYFSILLLLLTAWFVPVQSTWIWPLILVGVFGYVGDLVFFVALKHIDVSVTNISWVLLSICLSIGGYLWFGEVWTQNQTIGALLIFLGVLFLSLWHRKIGGGLALLLLPALALLYTPFYLVQKAALLAGQGAIPVFFWSLVGRELTSFCLPLLVPPMRRHVIQAAKGAGPMFFAINALVIVCFFAATWLTTLAFMVGPVSLVGIVGNVQPFIVLILAVVAVKLLPSWSPRELIDRQAITVKVVSFTVVFLGLALLALSQ